VFSSGCDQRLKKSGVFWGLFWVPLNGNAKTLTFEFNGFDNAILGGCCHAQTSTNLVDCLVVIDGSADCVV
jgi:hypothetical protein